MSSKINKGDKVRYNAKAIRLLDKKNEIYEVIEIIALYKQDGFRDEKGNFIYTSFEKKYAVKHVFYILVMKWLMSIG